MVADDDEVTRGEIRKWLERDPEIVVVGETADGAEASKLTMGLEPDVLLVNLTLSKLTGLEVTRRLRAAKSPVR